jgi:integrase
MLNEYYERIINDFLAVSHFNVNTKGDVVWIARKYFAWLISEGKHDLSCVGVEEVQGFLVHCSQHMLIGSIHNTKLFLKKLYRYLKDQNLSSQDFEELLSFKVIRGKRLFPAATPNDVAAILSQVDRRLPVGKRDYAMILLGAVTGLRAADIIRLKLTDIDWSCGEIKLVQTKTGNSLALPLTQDVGEAIQDYILNGRQYTESEEIFLRDHRPYRGFMNAVSIGNMYDAHRRKAGLPRDAFDGNGFHSLRRGVGKNLVSAQIPVTTVAQILGDQELDSVKPYIALDSIHLQECALSFEGIEPEGGDSDE